MCLVNIYLDLNIFEVMFPNRVHKFKVNLILRSIEAFRTTESVRNEKVEREPQSDKRSILGKISRQNGNCNEIRNNRGPRFEFSYQDFRAFNFSFCRRTHSRSSKRSSGMFRFHSNRDFKNCKWPGEGKS